jgi:3-hydroxyisobutyrate dehydrogenase
MTTQHRLGWIGLGRMGFAMAERLLKAKHDVAVWNRTREKALPLAERGARLVDGKAALGACDIVFTMVSTGDDLREVLFGAGGLLSGGAKPKLVCDSSSISMDASAGIRAELERRGIDFLCAPVSGNAKVVKAGKLTVVASGPRAAFELARPYLEALGRGVTYVGEGELARMVKIAHNTAFGVIFQSLAEITVLAEKAGIPRRVFLEFINNSVLGSMYTRYKTPIVCNLDFDHVTFTPKLLLKDMELGLAEGRKFGVPMPTASATRDACQAVVSRGHDDVDFSVLLLEQARNSGLELKPENVKVGDGLEA